MRRLIVATAALGALAIAVSPAAAAEGDGTVRFLHAAPGAPPVDVWVNGNKAVKRLKRGAITPYVELAPGTYRYAVRVAGTPKRPNNIVLGGAVTIAKDQVATIAVTDRIVGSRLKARVISDTAERPFGVGRVRVAHLSSDTPAVDVAIKGTGIVVAKLRFPRTTAYLDLPAGKYTFFVRPAGTKINAITARDVEIEAGSNYTAWALGALKPKKGEFSLRGLLTEDVLPTRFNRTQLRVLHASPGAPNVDVYVNGTRAIENLPFAKAAPDDGTYLKLPSGPIDVAIRAAGSPASSNPVYSAKLDLPVQGTVTAAARGQLSNSTFTVSAYGDDVSPTGGKARVTVVHLSPNTSAVDVYANAADTSGAPAVSGLTFPNQTVPSLVIPPATYTFGVTLAGQKTVALPVGPAALPADSATVVYALGLSGHAGTPLQAKAVTTILKK